MNEESNVRKRQNLVMGLVLVIIGLGVIVWDFWAWSNDFYPFDPSPYTDRTFNLMGAGAIAVVAGYTAILGFIRLTGIGKPRKNIYPRPR